MKNLFVQFKSGRTLAVEDICDYVESQDFDVVVAIDGKKESHVTIFHDAVEYMCVTDDIDEEIKEYETGLNEAWECARKITSKDIDTEEIFGDIPPMFIFRKYSASEAMAKIKEWERREQK